MQNQLRNTNFKQFHRKRKSKPNRVIFLIWVPILKHFIISLEQQRELEKENKHSCHIRKQGKWMLESSSSINIKIFREEKRKCLIVYREKEIKKEIFYFTFFFLLHFIVIVGKKLNVLTRLSGAH